MPLSQDLQPVQPWSNALRPGLYLDPLESPGQEISEAETDAIIRQILTDSAPPRAGRSALPDLAPQKELSARKPARAARQAREAQHDAAKAAKTPVTPPVEDLTPAAPARRWSVRRVKLRKLALWGVFGVFVWMWPWAVPVILFVAFWVALIACATSGSDWIGRGALRFYRWLELRDPARAERLRARADAVALHIDGWLDRLPERWTEGLYLPDFSRAALSPDTADDRPDPFDRIAAEARHI